jgi:hypothetical protein
VRRVHGRRAQCDRGLRRHRPARAAAAGRPRPHQPARPEQRRQHHGPHRPAPARRQPAPAPAARRGATIAALASGATLRYALSERGTLSVAIERAGARGRYKALPGALRRASTAGAHRLTFRARLHGRPLRVGRYRLVLRATDAAGNRSAARRLSFTVAVGR